MEMNPAQKMHARIATAKGKVDNILKGMSKAQAERVIAETANRYGSVKVDGDNLMPSSGFVPPPFRDIASVLTKQDDDSRARFAADRIRERREAMPKARVDGTGYSKAKAWAEGEKRIERPDGSMWYKAPTDWMGDERRDKTRVFVVEHDWAAALGNAAELDGGEWQLPYEICAFEFQVSGLRMILIMAESDTASNRPVGLLVRFGVDQWTATEDSAIMGPPPNLNKNDTFVAAGLKELYQRLINIARCLSIALDAEMATHEVVRAPHRLNSIRDKQGKKAVNDYHSVSVVRRSRVEPLPSGDEPHEARWHPRMHFRRGHWRHFQNHKTWIKWMLVGNPDLGFIDKHYRA